MLASPLDAVLSDIGPAPRRYPIVQGDHGVTHYGPWRVHYDPPPIPTRACDWHWAHDDFDGADDSGDNRAGSESSFAAALCACDDREDDA